MIQGLDIVCISSLDWDAHQTSKQHIMRRLAGPNRVLYVEEPVTLLAPLKVPARWKRWGALLPRVRQAQPGLWLLTPPPLLPFGNMYPRVNRANQRVMGAYIRRAARKIGLRTPVLWAYLPTVGPLIERLKPAAVLYHCVDEHSAFPGFVRPEVVRAYDDDLTRRADLVITTSRSLLESRRHLNPHAFHVPHACDVATFSRALDPGLPVPDDIAAIPRPRIGVVGVHDERLDLDAIEALAWADRSWQIVLIGPVQPGDVDESRLRAAENVHLLGGKRVSELPAYLKELDVALIPYKRNELTRNIFPLKLYEYLAAGVPVVAAALPELGPFSDTVALAESPADYPVLVREVLATDTPQRRIERGASAAGHTWEARVETISALVEEMLARKGLQSAAASPEGPRPGQTSPLGMDAR